MEFDAPSLGDDVEREIATSPVSTCGKTYEPGAGRSLLPGSLSRGEPMAIALLCAEIQSLKQENRDLEIALQTSHRHGDLLEEHLMGASMKLAAEVRERQVAEDKLRELLEAA